MEYRFGRENWFIKESIFKWLNENKEKIGIEFLYDKSYNWTDTNYIYAISNWLKWQLEVDAKCILAVLYKCKPVQIGELNIGICSQYNKLIGVNDRLEGE